eukprot:TRINITY_DN6232_c0_g1_i1.p1 TRINITY_DN6232_c0_g1~~TRINITY_DN6232_c0_g1_i1.p1  ORF type:complete len:293 (-),score=37.57 TRINITY_DN6232_c0_g1_i1:77-868(-)
MVVGQFTCPWSRPLSMGDSGKDVYITQLLLSRSPFVSGISLNFDFDSQTEQALRAFQTGNNLTESGTLDPDTANLLYKLHYADGYKDDGTFPEGYLYKIHIEVSSDRNKETVGYLYDTNGTLLYNFPARLHGVEGRNQYCSNGDTITGLFKIDLNTPEPEPKVYGPYPINRLVEGLEGNAKYLYWNNETTLRRGILLHTGEWANWHPPLPMPNSDGCIHTWPDSCNAIWKILTSIGVQIRTNTLGDLPYPYEPQGIISIEQVD